MLTEKIQFAQLAGFLYSALQIYARTRTVASVGYCWALHMKLKYNQ